MSPRPPQLSPTELAAYFAFTEVSSLLRHAVEKQLREVGKLSYVQFQVLARLRDAPDGSQRMTDLADDLVHSRSGLTYQAQLLEERGLVTRAPSPDDERSTIASITDEGRDVLAKVFPGHIEVVSSLLFESLADDDIEVLARVMTQVSGHLRANPPRSATRRRAGDTALRPSSGRTGDHDEKHRT
jgi:DNA-binding MarR family transcriptional regulator